MPIPIPRRPLLGWLALAAGLAGGWLVAIHRLNPPSSPPAGGTVEVQGVRLSASAQHDRQRAAELFGFDIRGAGLLPVHLSIHNQSHQAVRINPAQTFLIERGLAWPLLTADQARRRLAAVGAPFGLPGGFAIGLVAEPSGPTPPEQWLERTALGLGVRDGDKAPLAGRPVERLDPGQTARGYLFFPGQGEAQSADALRLALEIAGVTRIAHLPLAFPVPPAPPDQARPSAR
ncbi:hypothetical protein [Candidatus Methylocalor cossyra]|uniref:Cell division protein FtsQ n=1 Tax=Candidatus Methylocalor cossyra TaxID=3108543 RepID=A0ABM9NFC0_9GAMM